MFKISNLYILFIFYLSSSLIIADNYDISCSICENKIKDKEYYVDIWGNPFHIYHKKIGTFCECCSRIISEKITNGGYQLDDGRYICTLCDISIIKTEQEILKSFKEIKEILKKNGVNNINESEIDIELINKIEMANHYKFHEVEHLKGITKIDPNRNKPFHIYILDNLPKIQFEAILAHELLHIWLYKNNLTLDNLTMEGFCNLGSYLIYSLDDTKFSNIHLMSLENKDKNSDAHKYKILKSIMHEKSFKYILNNIKTINIP